MVASTDCRTSTPGGSALLISRIRTAAATVLFEPMSATTTSRPFSAGGAGAAHRRLPPFNIAHPNRHRVCSRR